MNKWILLVKNSNQEIVEEKKCKYCWEVFFITNLEKQLYDKYWFKYREICDECLFKMMLSYYNDKQFYYQEDIHGNKVVSIYSEEDFNRNVINVDEYIKKRNAEDYFLKYWKDVDLWEDIDFIKEYIKWTKKIPKMARLVFFKSEDSLYSSHIWGVSKTYMSFWNFVDCKDIYYSFMVLDGSKNIFSSVDVVKSNNIFESRSVVNSFNVYKSSFIENCRDIIYCKDMVNCQNCIFSCNQVNKSYLIFNKQYSKEEYEKKKQEILEKLKDKNGRKELENKWEEFLKENYIERATRKVNSDTSSWDVMAYTNNSVNVFYCLGVNDSVNCLVVWDSENDKNVNIINSIEWWSFCENVIWTASFGVNVSNLFFCYGINENSRDLYYCNFMINCQECMFCEGLTNKKYCIFNKQYDEKTYFDLKEKIINTLKKINRWWDFLGWEFSNFPYNDTLAYDFFELKNLFSINNIENNSEINNLIKKLFENYKLDLEEYKKLKNYLKTHWIHIKTLNENSKWDLYILQPNLLISPAIIDFWWDVLVPVKRRTKEKVLNIPQNAYIIKWNELNDLIYSNNIWEETLKSIIHGVILCEETEKPYRITTQEIKFYKKYNYPLPTIHPDIRRRKLLSERPIWKLYIRKCDNCWKEILSAFPINWKYKVYCDDCYFKFIY